MRSGMEVHLDIGTASSTTSQGQNRRAPQAAGLRKPQRRQWQPRSVVAASQGTDVWAEISHAGGQRFVEGFAAFRSALHSSSERLQQGSRPRPPGFPPGPPGDAAVSMLSDPLTFLEDTTRSYGGVAGLVLGGEHVVLVSDPDVAQDVLIDRASSFVKEGTAFFPGSRLAGNGLLVSDGDIWRRQRQLSNPAFRAAAVQTYTESMVTEAKELLNSVWRHGGRRSVYSDFNDLTLRITIGALFGSTVQSQQARRVSESIATAFRFFADRTAAGFSLPEWVPTPANLGYRAAVDQLDIVIYDLIAARRRQAISKPQDLLGNLMAARDDDGAGMSDTGLRDELMTLLVAGQETSAIVLAWASAFLAHHPAVQQEAAAEVRAVLGSRPPTANDVRSLHLVEAVILEALRLRPPAYMVGRCAATNLDLKDFHLSKGTSLVVSPYIMHRDARVWEYPCAFLPRRWVGELGSGHQSMARAALAGMGHRGQFVPFGAGPRNCIGTGFAMLETVVIIATILQQFEIKPLPHAAFPAAEPRITLRPSNFDLILLRRT